MKLVSMMAAGFLLAVSIAGGPAAAQSGSGCADIDFISSVTNRFPHADDACQGIVSREGRPYAHFLAEIVGVSGNSVRAKFKMPDGSYSDTYSFEMDSSDRVEIDGRSYRYRDLARGQELNVYLPQDRWEFHIPETEDFAGAQTVAVVMPVVDSGQTAMLPATASPLPLLGFAGFGLTLLGAGLLAVRARLSG